MLNNRTLEDKDRAALIAELERIEARMDAGEYETYSPEWLRNLFLKAYWGANS